MADLVPIPIVLFNRLGQAVVNSFNRAFHSWEGTTPAKWRKQANGHRAVTPRKRRVANAQHSSSLVHSVDA